MLPSTPGSPKWSPSFRSSDQNPVCTSLFPICATCLAHLILGAIQLVFYISSWCALGHVYLYLFSFYFQGNFLYVAVTCSTTRETIRHEVWKCTERCTICVVK
jgi:hypothetical protein